MPYITSPLLLKWLSITSLKIECSFYHVVNGCIKVIWTYANISKMVQLEIEKRAFFVTKFLLRLGVCNMQTCGAFRECSAILVRHSIFLHYTITWKKCNLTLLSWKLSCSVMHDIYLHNLVPMEGRWVLISRKPLKHSSYFTIIKL